MKKTISLLLLLTVICSHSNAQKINASLLTKTPRQYSLVEWAIRLHAGFSNPYLSEEIAVDLVYTDPGGKKSLLPCYYESGTSGSESTWKARFMPRQTGRYSYYFRVTTNGTYGDSSSVSDFTAKSGTAAGILHTNNNWTMKFDNGQTFRGVGENICWESRANDDSRFFKGLHEKDEYNYEVMIPALKNNGGNFFRTWICSWNLPIDWQKGFNNVRYQPSTEYFNPSAIRKMDRLVNLCDSLGVHMMLTLGQGAFHTRDGGFASSAADFFVNEKSKQKYKNRLRYFVARWGYSPSIAMWEFFNEVDNVQFSNKDNPINPAHITEWHTEMSAYLANLDPYDHPITTSISHRDIAGLNSIPDIDINQKHIYKNTRGMRADILKYSKEFNKPYIIGEFGYEWDWSKDFNLFADGMDSDFKRGLWYGLFTPTPVLPMSWWWEFFEDRGTDKYITRVRRIYDMMVASGKGSYIQQEVIAGDSAIALAVTAGTKTYIYVYNPSRNNIKTSVELKTLPGKTGKIQRYDPDADKLTSMNARDISFKSLKLEEVNLAQDSDCLFIIDHKK